MKISSLFKSGIVIAILFVLIAGYLYFHARVQKYREAGRTLTELEMKRERTAAQLQEYHKKQERFKTDPAFVEHVAHELGLAYSNETIFRIVDDESPAKKSAGPRIRLD